MLSHELNEHSNHGPHLTFRKRNLRRKILGTVELCGQDHVFIGILWRCARHEPNLHLVCTGQEGGSSPLGELEGVILKLRRENSTSLSIQPITPSGSACRGEFIEGKGSHVLGLLDETMELGTADEVRIASKIELSVTIGD